MFLSWARGVCGACGGLHMLIQDKVASIACQVVVAGRLRAEGEPSCGGSRNRSVPYRRGSSSPVVTLFRFSTQKAAVAASLSVLRNRSPGRSASSACPGYRCRPPEGTVAVGPSSSGESFVGRLRRGNGIFRLMSVVYSADNQHSFHAGSNPCACLCML